MQQIRIDGYNPQTGMFRITQDSQHTYSIYNEDLYELADQYAGKLHLYMSIVGDDADLVGNTFDMGGKLA